MPVTGDVTGIRDRAEGAEAGPDDAARAEPTGTVALVEDEGTVLAHRRAGRPVRRRCGHPWPRGG